MARPAYQGPANDSTDERMHRAQIAAVVNNMMKGKLNCTGVVTLTPSATTTILIDSRLSAFSFVALMPMTANAATALPVVYFSDARTGQITIHHASNAATDQNFTVLILG